MKNNSRYLTIPLLLLFLNIVMVFKTTAAFFSDSAQSSNNTFSAAAVFPTPVINPGDVVINEINWAGADDDPNDEWVELRNLTANSITIGGWDIVGLGIESNSITIGVGATIPANGFYLVSRKNKSASRVNVNLDQVDSSIRLVDSGEQLILKNGTTTIDTANGIGAWFAGVTSPEPKKSMERKNPPGDGTVSGNWQTATTHTNMDGSGSTDEFATPKATNGL